jgi:RNA-directed DNA polymerase
MTKPKNRSKSKDYIPVTVPFGARQTGDPDENSPGEISQWANQCVWTDRMLDTLIVGVRGGKWHALIDKVFSELNLFISARKVLGKKGAAGVDRQTVEDFAEHEIKEIRALHQKLREDTYRPSPVRRVWIPKGRQATGEKRPLGIPTVAAYCTSCNWRYG